MNNVKKRMLRSAVLLAVSVLLLTCMTVLGIFAEDTEKYTLELRYELYDDVGNEGSMMIRVELAKGEDIDLAAIIAAHPDVEAVLAELKLSDEGYVGLPADGKMPAGDLVVTAEYAAEPFTITWMVDGVAVTDTVKYGGVPSFPNGTPVKAPTAQYTYTFAGWDTEPAEAYGDATYTAQFTETVNEYTVTWIVDGKETSETYKYGETPSFKGSTDKAADAQYTYTFTGWDSEPVAVVGDATYTAQFTETVNEYIVTWIVEGVETTAKVPYGTVPTYDGTPAKEGNAQFSYTFSGWDSEPVAVVGDATYTAQFTETVNEYTVTWIVDGKETSETYKYGETPSFKGSTDKASNAQYTFTFTGWDKTVAAVEGNVTYTAQYENTVNEYTVTWIVDGKETSETYKYGETPSFKGSTDKPADNNFTYTFGGWDQAITAVTGDVTYTAQFNAVGRKFYVYFYYGHNTVLPTVVEYGQAAVAPTNTDKAPTASTVFEFAGWDVDFSNITGNLKVYAKYTETVRTYTVTFNYGDGKTETVTVEYGKGATAPADTDKTATDEYTYTFKGWDADFSKIVSDLTVNALYDQIPVKEPDTDEPTTNEPDTDEPETPAETDPETDPDTDPETDPDTNEPGVTDPETTTPDGETETDPADGDGCKGSWWWIILVIVVAAGVAVAVIILLRRKNEPETSEPESAPAPETEPETDPEPVAEAAPLFIPVGEEIPEEEIPAEVETVDEVAADDVDDMMTDKAAAAFLVTSDEEGGAGKMGIINVGLISAAYQAGDTVDLASLQEKGMIDGNVGRLKVLASGTLDKPLIIKADAFSVQAVKMITLTGGQAIELKGE